MISRWLHGYHPPPRSESASPRSQWYLGGCMDITQHPGLNQLLPGLSDIQVAAWISPNTQVWISFSQVSMISRWLYGYHPTPRSESASPRSQWYPGGCMDITQHPGLNQLLPGLSDIQVAAWISPNTQVWISFSQVSVISRWLHGYHPTPRSESASPRSQWYLGGCMDITQHPGLNQLLPGLNDI